MRTCLALLCVVALAARPCRADDPEPPPAKDVELKALQGTWQVTSATSPNGPEVLAGVTMTFAKNKLIVRQKDYSIGSTFTIDPKKSPKQIDITLDITRGQIGRAHV